MLGAHVNKLENVEKPEGNQFSRWKAYDSTDSKERHKNREGGDEECAKITGEDLRSLSEKNARPL